MASSPQKHEAGLVCRVRRTVVADSPEERVRQELLSFLAGPGGYPPGLLAVEVSLASLVGLVQGPLPRRRLDIVCFHPLSQGGLAPLLLVECKAAAPRPSALSQVNGYNRSLQAAAVALAWPGAIVLCRDGATLYQGSIAQMPSYEILRKILFQNSDSAYSNKEARRCTLETCEGHDETRQSR